MKSMKDVRVVLALTLLSLTGVSACAGRMEGGSQMMLEKGGVMGKEGSMKEPEKTMMKESSGSIMETKMRMARLAGSDGHHAAGTVAITASQSGASVLQLKDISVDRVPDGRVYLAKNGDYRNGVELGKLTQFSGTVTLPLPSGISGEDYDSVVLWCKKFSVEIGRAFFDKSNEAGGSMMGKENKMMGADKTSK